MSRSSHETNDAVVRYMKENFNSTYKIIDIGAGAGRSRRDALGSEDFGRDYR